MRVISLVALSRGGRWRTEAMRSHARPVLYSFSQGKGRFFLSGDTFGYSKGTMALVPKGVMHGFQVNNQVLGHAIFWPRNYATDLFDEPITTRLTDLQEQVMMQGLIEQLALELETERDGQVAACHAILDLLAVKMQRYKSEAEDEGPGDAASRLVSAYTALLSHDYSSGKTVAEYAASLKVTPTHLSRVCRAKCGKSASALLMDRIFFEARRLLLETSMPIKEIAARLGFRSAAYFTRAFTQRIGKPPSEFRSDPN